MFKKALSLLLLPLLLGGCAAVSNLTPSRQVRNAEHVYPVEVKLSSRQQTLRWDTIKAQVVVGNRMYDMQSTPLMTNRWEGELPVPPGVKTVHYHYQFSFQENAFGSAKPGVIASPEYTLRIVDSSQQPQSRFILSEPAPHWISPDAAFLVALHSGDVQLLSLFQDRSSAPPRHHPIPSFKLNLDSLAQLSYCHMSVGYVVSN